ncbi:MAG: GAF domain-containing sensor histidine kinase [Anaerolineae bacterium]
MNRIVEIVENRHFWIVTAMLAICTVFHYMTLDPISGAFSLTRQSVVRIIYLLPVAAASFAFGYTGGCITLALAVLLMLPRVFLISPQPVDAFFETVGVGIVGYIVVWMIETQEKEKRLRQRVVEELQAVNAITLTLTQPYDLDAMLDKALARVLEIVGGLQPMGVILLLEPRGKTLRLRAQRGMPDDFLGKEKKVLLDECLCGLVVDNDHVLVMPNALDHPQHVWCPYPAPHAHVCVPLKSKQRVVGIMDFYLDASVSLDGVDREMLAAIGRQIGVAVENARLCENLRFYVRKITRAQEEERKRIARELHDDTVQRLIDLSRRVDNLSLPPEVPARMVEALETLQGRIQDTLDNVRRFSRDLRPSVLDDLGLLPAIEGLLADLESRGIETALGIEGRPRRLKPEAEIDLYRIVQEALNNVRRHAEASRVVLTVDYGEKQIQILVRDNGKGFEGAGQPGDFASAGMYGLVGMQERAQRLHGQLRIVAPESEGTVVVVEVPI